MRSRRIQTLSIVPLLLLVVSIAVLVPREVHAQQVPAEPAFSIQFGGQDLLQGDEGISSAMKLVFLLSAISFVPGIILTMTSFTRIIVVLSMTRTALGTQQAPPNMVLTGLSLFLTVAIMNPILQKSYDAGIQPYMNGQMGGEEAWKKGSEPIKQFLVSHSREQDLALFLDITKSEFPEEAKDVPFHVAVPAFVLSELNTAFQIGFLIALPFLVLDMVVSSILTSMSMITLPPVVISLPLKLMLFVVVDGWHLIIGSLVQTYHVT
ncbi:MAG: flagellar type III secretion system pore protein FliP [Bdellovibrionales bacterium]|nr:flagellar type III secretion system pore protein FliP [Bdellovibrionales bacterium]